VCAARRPAYGLPFIKAFVDDLVGRGLDEAGGDPLPGSKVFAVVHDVTQIVADIRRKLTQGGAQLSQGRGSRRFLQGEGDIIGQTFDVIDGLRGGAMPQQPFDPLQRRRFRLWQIALISRLQSSFTAGV
jgi:hypothetical protein